jgi:DNA-binding GntR family transcriptional regulator
MNALLDAIERGDGAAASEASAAHIRRASELAQKALSQLPDPE